MKKGKATVGARQFRGKNLRIAIVVSRFNDFVTARLQKGAEACLQHFGMKRSAIKIVTCPGAFELPQVANRLAATKRWDAIVCLGAVIKGETRHDEYIAAEAARGIQQVALMHDLPVLFGVLTTKTERQALDRAGGKHGNKGWDAAEAAIHMATVFKRYRKAKA